MAEKVAASDRVSGGLGAPAGAARSGALGLALLGAGLAGGLLLAVSQFLPLYHTHVQSRHAAIASATVGSQHGYALLPIAALAALLAYGVWSVGSRPALLGLGVLGLASLLIALLGDLPDAQGQGLRVIGGHYVLAANSVALGLYVETLGAMVLLAGCVSGFILLGPPRRRSPERASTAAGGQRTAPASKG